MVTERAVLIVGHGTISEPNDVPEFLVRIRRGRPPSSELIRDIQQRYAKIGQSPLLEATQSLGRALELRLSFPVRVAMRFWNPLIEDVLRETVALGVQELCILPVAPFSVHVYAGVVTEALSTLVSSSERRPRVVPVAPYGSDVAFVRAQASTVASLLATRTPDDTELILTAHSLPIRVLATGDPYQTQFEASARAIAEVLGWPARIAYQSQGAGGGEWLGPTLDEALVGAKERGRRGVVVAPVGFLADHVETLYDLDIEAADRARQLGLEFVRARALGDHPSLVEALEGVVRRAL